MVVAGVWLGMLYGDCLLLFVMVFLLALSIINHYDLKKGIAYSTSLHLTMILLIIGHGLYRGVVVYILLHGIVKGQIFQMSGVVIHGCGGQDLRIIPVGLILVIAMMGILLLTAGCGIVMSRGKEQIVVDFGSLLILCVVILTFVYTKSFINKQGYSTTSGEVVGMYIFMVVLISLSLLVLLGEWNLSLLIFCSLILLLAKKRFQVIL